MLRKITLAAGLIGSLVSAPAFAGTAAAGLSDMSKWNLIVLGDWQASSDVEGRAIVVGKATGTGVQVGNGRSVAGQSGTVTTDPTLVIGGDNMIGSLTINNGSNGGNGNIGTASKVWIGGNAQTNNSVINLNGGGATQLFVAGNYKTTVNTVFDAQIGGNMTGGTLGPANSSSTIKFGGQKTGGTLNANGATVTQNVAGLKTNLQNAVSGMTSSLADDLTTLSTKLSSLTLGSNPSSTSVGGGGQTLILNAIKGNNGYSLINLNQNDLVGFSSIAYNFNPDAGPVIINFTGKTLTSGPNIGKIEATLGLNFVTLKDANQNPLTDDFTKVNQSVIWNFGNADFVKFNTEFFGSVLAVNGEVSNVNAINGSVVAKTFKQGGEVHLGTLDYFEIPTPPTPPILNPVPEPATWAMMIMGFGLVGAARRRQARVRFA